jgi:hypothetical protein
MGPPLTGLQMICTPDLPNAVFGAEEYPRQPSRYSESHFIRRVARLSRPKLTGSPKRVQFICNFG